MYIVEVKKSNRGSFIKSFEDKGFKVEERFSREDIVKSVLPITLDFDNKTIGRIGNVTCACVALKYGKIQKEEDIKKFILSCWYSFKDNIL